MTNEPEQNILSAHFIREALADCYRMSLYQATIEPHKTDAQKDREFRSNIEELGYEVD